MAPKIPHRVSITMPKELHRKYSKCATELDLSFSAFVRKAMQELCKKECTPPKK